MNSLYTQEPEFSEKKWQEELRRRELIRFAISLADLAESVQLNEDFTTKTPPKLANIICQISTIMAEKIPTVSANYLQVINVFLNNIASHLRYVERAKVTQTPWSLIQTAENFFKNQIGEKSNFIIRPTWSYNYAVIGDFWDYYKVLLGSWDWFPIETLENILKSNDHKQNRFYTDESIYCISFPRLEKQNCLLHANWGHEVGHIIVNKWMENSFEPLWRGVEDQIKQRIRIEVKKSPPPVDPIFKEIAIDETVSNLTKATMEASRQGLIELLCDIIGVHIFGLSAIAAVLEFASRFELDASPLKCDYYPPWRYRLRKMFEYCKKDLEDNTLYPTKILSSFIKWLNESKNLSNCNNDIDIINSDIQTKEAYDFIEQNWNVVIGDIIITLTTDFINPYRFFDRKNTIETLVERLISRIPPNEEKNLSLTPSSFQDIIASAWVFKISKVLDDPNWGEKEDLNLLYRLVLKATECSYVQSTWGPKLENIET